MKDSYEFQIVSYTIRLKMLYFSQILLTMNEEMAKGLKKFFLLGMLFADDSRTADRFDI